MAIEKPSWWEVQYTTESDGYKNNGGITGPMGLLVHSTAWPGKDAQYIRNDFNRPKRGASIHGVLDDKRFIQTMPLTKRAGHVGSGSKGTLNNTSLGIEICEPSGITYNSAGSAIVSYNPPAGYFEAVRDKAIELYAYLCQLYDIDPLQHDAAGGIVAHYEAHALGYGDNHADIRHWWEVCEKYTMDMFRQDVSDYIINGGFEVIYNTIDEIPTWGQATIQKLVDKGFLTGTGDGLNINETMLRLLVINDRAGLYG